MVLSLSFRTLFSCCSGLTLPCCILTGGVYPTASLQSKQNKTEGRKSSNGEKPVILLSIRGTEVKGKEESKKRRKSGGAFAGLFSCSTGCIFLCGGELKCLFPQKVATRQHFVFKASASCLPLQLAHKTRRSLAV